MATNGDRGTWKRMVSVRSLTLSSLAVPAVRRCYLNVTSGCPTGYPQSGSPSDTGSAVAALRRALPDVQVQSIHKIAQAERRVLGRVELLLGLIAPSWC